MSSADFFNVLGVILALELCRNYRQFLKGWIYLAWYMTFGLAKHRKEMREIQREIDAIEAELKAMKENH